MHWPFNKKKTKEIENVENPIDKHDYEDSNVKTYLVTIEYGDFSEHKLKKTFKFKSNTTGDKLYEELDTLIRDWVYCRNHMAEDITKISPLNVSVICFQCLG